MAVWHPITPQNAQNRELSPFRSSEESLSTPFGTLFAPVECTFCALSDAPLRIANNMDKTLRLRYASQRRSARANSERSEIIRAFTIYTSFIIMRAKSGSIGRERPRSRPFATLIGASERARKVRQNAPIGVSNGHDLALLRSPSQVCALPSARDSSTTMRRRCASAMLEVSIALRTFEALFVFVENIGVPMI